MPTNLPPEYHHAEKRYKSASTPQEKIETLEELISTIPKHKGTDRLRADFRKRLSKMKSASQSKKGKSKREPAFHIVKEGAGQVAVIGSANVGKSSLVATLTNASPEIGDYAFTTQKPQPGMMPVGNIKIQLVDTPAISRDLFIPELFELIRGADLLLLVLNMQSDPFQQLEESLTMLKEHHIIPLRHKDRHVPERRTVYLPFFILVNQCDEDDSEEDFDVFRELLNEDWPLLPVSAKNGRNLERLKQELFDRLQIIRIYSKTPGKDPDMQEPFVLKHGSTIEEFAEKLHKDFYANLKAARVWGKEVFDGQMVGRDHVLNDGDIVELLI